MNVFFWRKALLVTLIVVTSVASAERRGRRGRGQEFIPAQQQQDFQPGFHTAEPPLAGEAPQSQQQQVSAPRPEAESKTPSSKMRESILNCAGKLGTLQPSKDYADFLIAGEDKTPYVTLFHSTGTYHIPLDPTLLKKGAYQALISFPKDSARKEKVLLTVSIADPKKMEGISVRTTIAKAPDQNPNKIDEIEATNTNSVGVAQMDFSSMSGITSLSQVMKLSPDTIGVEGKDRPKEAVAYRFVNGELVWLNSLGNAMNEVKSLNQAADSEHENHFINTRLTPNVRVDVKEQTLAKATQLPKISNIFSDVRFALDLQNAQKTVLDKMTKNTTEEQLAENLKKAYAEVYNKYDKEKKFRLATDSALEKISKDFKNMREALDICEKIPEKTIAKVAKALQPGLKTSEEAHNLIARNFDGELEKTLKAAKLNEKKAETITPEILKSVHDTIAQGIVSTYAGARKQLQEKLEGK